MKRFPTFGNILRFSVGVALFPLGMHAQAVPAETDFPADSVKNLFDQVFLEGKFHADFRARYEYADQSNLRAGHAGTFRTRLGYTTNKELPLFGMIELNDVRAIDRDGYNVPGVNNQPQKTAIADPQTTVLNQFYLNFAHEGFSARVGRQRVTLDDQRFLSNSAWRQTEQTFDAAVLRYEFENGPAFFYGYIDQVNRVLGKSHGSGRWDSDSHLINVRTPVSDLGSVGGYAYLLKFKSAPASSGDTYGAWVRPELTRYSIPLSFYFEIAHQGENSENPAGSDFSHRYYRLSAEYAFEPVKVGAGFERLEGDGTTAFQTPIGGLHIYNGWADQFSLTPANGLDDIFVYAGGKLPGEVNARVSGHRFTAQRGDETYGYELDLLLSRPITENLSVLAKSAFFDGKDGRPDMSKIWVQTELRF